MMDGPSQTEAVEKPLPTLRLVVGLGNPGERYRNTRHNSGFMVADALMSSCPDVRKADWQPERGELYEIRKDGHEALLVLKPMTYMNDSGDAVVCVTERFGISPPDMLVICDDLDLPAGRLRLRPRGSCGGQRGVLSIINRLGTDGFPRLRVGIGRPRPEEMEIIDYVLSNWASADEELLKQVLQAACDAVKTAWDVGLEAAMNKANSWRADCINAEESIKETQN